MSQKCADVWYAFMRGLVIPVHVSHLFLYFFTILSMSDCLGMCFLMINNGESTGTSGWDFCVYSISGGLMVLTACISKSGCFSDILL